MAFIELKDVSYKYPYTKNFALQNVTCSFERGKFYGIIGENGGGKTTLCNLIRGLIPHFYRGKLTGECLVEGKDIREWDTAELSSKIGYVFQNPFTQISGIKPTVFEEVAIGLENLGVPKEIMLDRVAKVCEQLDIGHLIKNNPNELSGGQRQRVAFASIIAMDTDTLVIDEPTSQLDPEGTESVFNIINQLKHSNKTIILVEHKIDLIAEFEGFLPELTADYITDDPTIGHGKVITTNEHFYNNLTRDEAYAYLCQTVNAGGYTTRTNSFLVSNGVKFNQNQFDALVCFAYNCGSYAITNDDDLSSILLNTGTGSTVSIKAGDTGFVNEDSVNLRQGAGTGFAVVKTLDINTKFTFIDAKLYNSSWYKVRLSDGTEGYIYSSYATSDKNGGTRDLNNVNKSQFLQHFLQWHHAAGECYWGLLTRRIDEAEMFFYGDYLNDGYLNKYNFSYTCPHNPGFGI